MREIGLSEVLCPAFFSPTCFEQEAQSSEHKAFLTVEKKATEENGNSKNWIKKCSCNFLVSLWNYGVLIKNLPVVISSLHELMITTCLVAFIGDYRNRSEPP